MNSLIFDKIYFQDNVIQVHPRSVDAVYVPEAAVVKDPRVAVQVWFQFII